MHGSERMLHITSTRSDLNFRGYVDLDRFGLYEHRKVIRKADMIDIENVIFQVSFKLHLIHLYSNNQTGSKFV